MKNALIKCFGKVFESDAIPQVRYADGYETITGYDLTIAAPCPHAPGTYRLGQVGKVTGKEITIDNTGRVVIDGITLAQPLEALGADVCIEPFEWPDATATSMAVVDLTAKSRDFATMSAFASSDEGRPNLNGVWITGSRIVATDGHRLAMYRDCVTNTITQDVLIRNCACKAISALKWDHFTVHPGKVWTMACNGADGVLIAWRNVDLDMPAFDRVISAEANGRVTIKRDHLALAQKVKAPVIRYNGNVEFWPQVDQYNRGYVRNAKALLAVDEKMVDGIDNAFGINASYLRSIYDVLGFGKSDAMIGTIKDLHSAIVFRANDDLALVMPINFWSN